MVYSLFALLPLLAAPSLSATVERRADIPTVADNSNPACAPWYDIRDAIMGSVYHGQSHNLLLCASIISGSGRCNDLARASVRLAFHDAGNVPLDPNINFDQLSSGTFSIARQKAGKPNSGPDGSLLIDPNEVGRPENNGLQNIVAAIADLPGRFGVSPGDVLQV